MVGFTAGQAAVAPRNRHGMASGPRSIKRPLKRPRFGSNCGWTVTQTDAPTPMPASNTTSGSPGPPRPSALTGHPEAVSAPP